MTTTAMNTSRIFAPWLADAYALSRDEEIGGYVRNGLKVIGCFPEGLGHFGLGKAMAMQMRYVPGIQAALAGHSHSQSTMKGNPQ